MWETVEKLILSCKSKYVRIFPSLVSFSLSECNIVNTWSGFPLWQGQVIINEETAGEYLFNVAGHKSYRLFFNDAVSLENIREQGSQP